MVRKTFCKRSTPKITKAVTKEVAAAMKLKDAYSLEGKL